MKDYLAVYEFFQSYTNDNIFDFLKQPSGQQSGYIQEALLRLFGGLQLIDKLNNYTPAIGNFNKKTITKQTTYKQIFFKKGDNPRSIKGNSGDVSDFTMMSKTDNKHLLIISSKSLNKEKSGSLDIAEMSLYAQQYIDMGYKITFGFCVKDKKKTDDMINRTNSSSKNLADIYNRDDTIIIDWNDLNDSYHNFNITYTNRHIDTIIKCNKMPLKLKMHQSLSVLKTLQIKQTSNKKILWGHIPRSGKSYIIAGCIIEDSKDKEKCNYLVMTLVPNETIDQYVEVFNCINLDQFNIILLDGKNKNIQLSDKNIIICSKQFLQSKIKETTSINWLKKMNIEMRFIDESHNGGTTELAQKTLNYYGKKAFTVQITATYSKPINDYNISKDCWILWDLEDIKLCKNIKNEQNIKRLIEKHGDDINIILDKYKYSLENIINEYSKYPDLEILSWGINESTLPKLIKRNKNSDQGWSCEGAFLGNWDLKKLDKKDKLIFQKKNKVLEIFNHIFGEYDEFGIKDDKYPIKNVFIQQIKDISIENNSRHIDDYDEPLVIMAFLPQNHIYNISKCTKDLLEKEHPLFDTNNGEYIIININSKEKGDGKQRIADGCLQAINSNKKGVLVLSGKQCSLGVSIPNCDIVLLLNNNTGFDMIYQMMYRSMTEGENKKYGFVVDLNIHRIINTILIEYGSILKPDEHPKKGIEYILRERLIGLNSNHWKYNFGHDSDEENKLTQMINNIYKIYISNTEFALKHFLNRLCYKKIILLQEEQEILNTMFSNITPTVQQKEQIEQLLDEDEENIKKGIEEIKVHTSSDDISSEKSNINQEEKEDIKINYMDILTHIIPLLCLLTIHNEETSFVEMYNIVEHDKCIYNIFIDQIKSWWGKNISPKLVNKFISIYKKYMEKDKETKQLIRTIKELFINNKRNSKELSKLIDKYLIPQELEKK